MGKWIEALKKRAHAPKTTRQNCQNPLLSGQEGFVSSPSDEFAENEPERQSEADQSAEICEKSGIATRQNREALTEGGSVSFVSASEKGKSEFFSRAHVPDAQAIALGDLRNDPRMHDVQPDPFACAVCNERGDLLPFLRPGGGHTWVHSACHAVYVAKVEARVIEAIGAAAGHGEGEDEPPF